jgi:hypothetical protein
MGFSHSSGRYSLNISEREPQNGCQICQQSKIAKHTLPVDIAPHQHRTCDFNNI